MSTPNNLSRRLFLQRAAVGTLMASGGATLLAGCASGGGDDDAGGGGAEKTADNPFGVKKADPLDVVIFKGGYGDDYAKAHEDAVQEEVRRGRRSSTPASPTSPRSCSRASTVATRRT